MENYKEEIRKIHRKTAKLNLYVSICNADNNNKIINDLIIIKKDVDKILKNFKL